MAVSVLVVANDARAEDPVLAAFDGTMRNPPVANVDYPILFGSSVGMENGVLVVSAPRDEGFDVHGVFNYYDRGVVRVYQDFGAGFVLTQTLTNPARSPTYPQDFLFGAEIVLRGDTLAVLSPWDEQNPLHFFVWTGSEFVFDHTLVLSDHDPDYGSAIARFCGAPYNGSATNCGLEFDGENLIVEVDPDNTGPERPELWVMDCGACTPGAFTWTRRTVLTDRLCTACSGPDYFLSQAALADGYLAIPREESIDGGPVEIVVDVLRRETDTWDVAFTLRPEGPGAFTGDIALGDNLLVALTSDKRLEAFALNGPAYQPIGDVPYCWPEPLGSCATIDANRSDGQGLGLCDGQCDCVHSGDTSCDPDCDFTGPDGGPGECTRYWTPEYGQSLPTEFAYGESLAIHDGWVVGQQSRGSAFCAIPFEPSTLSFSDGIFVLRLGSATWGRGDHQTAIDNGTLVVGDPNAGGTIVVDDVEYPGARDMGLVSVYRLEPALPQGASCATHRDCANGNCIDGVCCETLCAAYATDCMACSVASGGSEDGRCTPVADGQDCYEGYGFCSDGVCLEYDAGPYPECALEPGVPDGGPDAGAPLDAGYDAGMSLMMDAGASVTDAGVLVDAGANVDAGPPPTDGGALNDGGDGDAGDDAGADEVPCPGDAGQGSGFLDELPGVAAPSESVSFPRKSLPFPVRLDVSYGASFEDKLDNTVAFCSDGFQVGVSAEICIASVDVSDPSDPRDVDTQCVSPSASASNICTAPKTCTDGDWVCDRSQECCTTTGTVELTYSRTVEFHPAVFKKLGKLADVELAAGFSLGGTSESKWEEGPGCLYCNGGAAVSQSLTATGSVTGSGSIGVELWSVEASAGASASGCLTLGGGVQNLCLDDPSNYSLDLMGDSAMAVGGQFDGIEIGWWKWKPDLSGNLFAMPEDHECD
jgi:hypothetical protein